jgi:hypothetical protein
LGTGYEQRDVVGRAVPEHGREDVVADGLQRRRWMGERAPKLFEPHIDVVITGLDEAVSVESKDAARRQFDLCAFEGQTAQAQWRARRHVNEAHCALGSDKRRQRVAGAGHAAPAGHGIVDRVQARRADVFRCGVVGTCI